jgi:hypothetical protein
MPGSRPTWYLTHEYVGRDPTCDLQELQVAPLTVPFFLEGRIPADPVKARSRPQASQFVEPLPRTDYLRRLSASPLSTKLWPRLASHVIEWHRPAI